MKWFVMTSGTPSAAADAASERETGKCDCGCTTSGDSLRSRRRTSPPTRHGRATRNVSWTGVRTEATRCTVTGPSRSVPGRPSGDGLTTWTSCPRPARPSDRRSAKRAAPLTSGAKVSAPTTTRSGRPGSVARGTGRAGVRQGHARAPSRRGWPDPAAAGSGREEGRGAGGRVAGAAAGAPALRGRVRCGRGRARRPRSGGRPPPRRRPAAPTGSGSPSSTAPRATATSGSVTVRTATRRRWWPARPAACRQTSPAPTARASTSTVAGRGGCPCSSGGSTSRVSAATVPKHSPAARPSSRTRRRAARGAGPRPAPSPRPPGAATRPRAPGPPAARRRPGSAGRGEEQHEAGDADHARPGGQQLRGGGRRAGPAGRPDQGQRQRQHADGLDERTTGGAARGRAAAETGPGGQHGRARPTSADPRAHRWSADRCRPRAGRRRGRRARPRRPGRATGPSRPGRQRPRRHEDGWRRACCEPAEVAPGPPPGAPVSVTGGLPGAPGGASPPPGGPS